MTHLPYATLASPRLSRTLYHIRFVRWYGADGNAMWLPASEVLGAVGSSVGNILAVQSLRSAQDFAWLRVSIDKVRSLLAIPAP